MTNYRITAYLKDGTAKMRSGEERDMLRTIAKVNHILVGLHNEKHLIDSVEVVID